MALKDDVTTWLVGVAVRKAIPKVVTATLAMVAAKYTPGLEEVGIRIDWNVLQMAVINGLVLTLDMFRNYVKVKTGIQEL